MFLAICKAQLRAVCLLFSGWSGLETLETIDVHRGKWGKCRKYCDWRVLRQHHSISSIKSLPESPEMYAIEDIERKSDDVRLALQPLSPLVSKFLPYTM
jgi:hypothetical protein